MKRHIKHRHMPGHIPKAAKIDLLESNKFNDLDEPERRKAYKKIILMKERAVLKRRFLKLLKGL